ncbi:MAG: hypothetical protein R2769_08315 [Saprospiraceae bacterium]
MPQNFEKIKRYYSPIKILKPLKIMYNNVKFHIPVLFLFATLIFACEETRSTDENAMEFKQFEVTYPDIKRIHLLLMITTGGRISDPYRWLEDDNGEDTFKVGFKPKIRLPMHT